MSDDSGEKEFAPSAHKLQEARRKGELPMGRDLLAAAGLGGLALAALASPDSLLRLATAAAVLLDQADRLAPLMASGTPSPLGGLAWAVGVAIAPFFGLPMVAVIAALVAQNAFVVAPSRLEPKLSRISPIEGAKKKFGRAGLFEFSKSFVKLAAVSSMLGVYLAARSDAVLSSIQLQAGQVVALLGQILIEFLALVVALQLAIGGVDLLWQRAEHLRKNRMSRKEMMDEVKQSEGNPEVKAQRRRQAMEIASNRMMADVPKADVVIVNPTHYAVALKWDRTARGAPVCVAKGVDETAARIRKIAAEAGVPLRHDPPTARVLHATVEIGAQIRPEHYRAVAAAIRFAEAMRQRARGRPKE